ncbi:MAG: DUF4432 family protein [Chloroflexi bacterium]|nr:DUF4432 family protein [Chloroflexota bacterium]
MHYQEERTHGCRISDAWTFRGLKVVILENEVLRVTVLADKGADIYELIHKPTDTDFMWRTPWGVRDPRRFIPTTGWPAGIWHDVYEGGWQTLAPTGGEPMTYAGAEIGQHSEATTMPWDVQVVDDTLERVAARFWVRTYRTPFRIEKTLSLEQGSAALTIEETVTNEAEEEVDCMWGQHIALGAPFLSLEARLDVPGGEVLVPGEGERETRRLKTGQRSKWPSVLGPGGERVDLHHFPPKSARVQDYAVILDMPEGWYAVSNPARGVGFAFAYPVETFKYLWYWQVFGGGGGYPWYRRTYNVGLEPFSSLANGRPLPGTRKSTAFRMKAGESRSATMRAIAYEVPKTGFRGVSRVTAAGKVIRARD